MNSQNTVLFIEPRQIAECINVLTQTYFCLGNEWKYVFYCGKSSFEYWKTCCPVFVELRPLECDHFTSDEYSDFLKKKELWKSLYGEFVLTIQLDTWILNIAPYTMDYFMSLNKSYIGGNMRYTWRQLVDLFFIDPAYRNFNGGLSIRKRKDMIRIIQAFPPEKSQHIDTVEGARFEKYAEDVYFTIGCYMLKLPVGDDEASSHFAIHTLYHESFFGIHNVENQVGMILDAKYPHLKDVNPYVYRSQMNYTLAPGENRQEIRGYGIHKVEKKKMTLVF